MLKFSIKPGDVHHKGEVNTDDCTFEVLDVVRSCHIEKTANIRFGDN